MRPTMMLRPGCIQRGHIGTLTAVFSLQFLVLLPLLCYTMPFSLYFKLTTRRADASKQAVLLNRERVKRARGYIENLSTDNSRYYTSLLEKGNQVFLAVAVLTVNRPRSDDGNRTMGYLVQSATALDKFAKSREFMGKTFVFICNVDVKPHSHKDAVDLKRYLPFTERYGSSDFHSRDFHVPNNKTVTYDQMLHEDVYEKETYDYMYCMRVAQSLGPRYILMVEDDAVAHPDLAPVLHYTLGNHFGPNTDMIQQNKSFAYLKLYYPQRWQGFAFELIRLLELCSISCIGGGFFVFVMYVLTFVVKGRVMVNKLYGRYFLMGMLFLMLTAMAVGRQNVLELRRVSKYLYQFRSSPGCCTQAMLYPTHMVRPLVSHLAAAPPGTHTDLIIYNFTRTTGTPAFQLEPNLFYHVGMYTSLKIGNKRPDEFLFHL
ncbi:post-GPI attachment to proteins factor 4-like [Haliotis rufescens]|uniref:post-GPI attachment to proteins factor 4-like n=1 Tax=Haliotis rufescens TaxID=6454 RepID=UPI00201EF47F|nr:post-GPI attachment to proteins factor 4-like [Haliotis rufescens]XP_046352168.2 post-GPI attachment to proteins factor 4-like [Haliotis rufescens]XP_046352169.2 post-GPI attachment to proteins factor 4-like [Haliotis rufescens]XP_046352170.2 post-GPI attachment to proteins factor 4-like [Haliotis rufescens]XP_046352171.2 post-GPI attachment to proteins factor 4-like [Haliotis rufescens]XP_048259180.1 post-GPI attachment to proteins factor 4-like [Haliotis rufescens]